MKDEIVYIFAVYKNPKDYPGKFVVRRWSIDKIGVRYGELLAVEDTIENARALGVPKGLIRIGRQTNNDPCIEEMWI